MATLICEIPDDLSAAVSAHIHHSDYRDTSDLVTEALRYYLDRHRTEAWEAYVDEEMAWSEWRAAS